MLTNKSKIHIDIMLPLTSTEVPRTINMPNITSLQIFKNHYQKVKAMAKLYKGTITITVEERCNFGQAHFFTKSYNEICSEISKMLEVDA